MDLRDALTIARDFLDSQIATLPPPSVEVSTVTELVAALAQRAPRIWLEPGRYETNLTIAAAVVLEGHRDAELAPLDPLAPTLLITGSDVTVSGITILGGATDRECIVVGDVYATDAAAQPSRVTLSDLAVTAGPDGGHRGIALHGSDLTVQFCAITGWREVGRDSQGIWINNGPGPYTITDNYIEASGENILTGGADPRIPGCVPSDILIARNTITKPASFAGAQNKNAIELKNARRVVITENTITNDLPTLLHDALIQLTPRNQDGNAPWCTLEDIEITKNTIRTAAPGFAINILGQDNEKPSQQAKRIRIAGNLWLTTQGYQVLGGIAESLVIEHDTLPVITRKLFSFSGVSGINVMTPLTYRNNVAKAGLYAITGDGNQAFGLPSLQAFAIIAEWAGNVIEDGDTHAWPAGQTVLPKDGLAPLLDPQTYKLLTGTAGW
jgi:hypothetical protein